MGAKGRNTLHSDLAAVTGGKKMLYRTGGGIAGLIAGDIGGDYLGKWLQNFIAARTGAAPQPAAETK
jgi:hypothetical protein